MSASRGTASAALRLGLEDTTAVLRLSPARLSEAAVTAPSSGCPTVVLAPRTSNCYFQRQHRQPVIPGARSPRRPSDGGPRRRGAVSPGRCCTPPVTSDGRLSCCVTCADTALCALESCWCGSSRGRPELIPSTPPPAPHTCAHRRCPPGPWQHWGCWEHRTAGDASVPGRGRSGHPEQASCTAPYSRGCSGDSELQGQVAVSVQASHRLTLAFTARGALPQGCLPCVAPPQVPTASRAASMPGAPAAGGHTSCRGCPVHPQVPGTFFLPTRSACLRSLWGGSAS